MKADIQRQLDTATAFFLAGERCSLDLRFAPYDFHHVWAPTLVNYAFSVELALKVIHVLAHGVTKTGHNLKDLFDTLPAAVQETLPNVAECVAEIATYFEDWRYPHEKDSLIGDAEYPRRAFIECYREIRRLRPGLCSSYESAWGGLDPEWVRAWPDSLRFDIKAYHS